MNQNGSKASDEAPNHRGFRKAVGRVLVSLSFRARQKPPEQRFYGNGCDGVAPKSDNHLLESRAEATNDQLRRKNCIQSETLSAVKVGDLFEVCVEIRK